MQYNMNKIIRLALIEMLNSSEIVASWGISEIQFANNKLIFNVNAFKYKGKICISANRIDNCKVLLNGGKELICDLKGLVSSLDELIEHTETYYEDLGDWLHRTDKAARAAAME